MSFDARYIGKVLARRADGRYLVLRGSVWPERPDRSQKPDLPGGIVEAGESLYDGASRELAEEAGIVIDASMLRPIYTRSFVDTQEHKFVIWMLFVADVGENPQVTISWEHEGYEWLTGEQLLGLDIRDPYPIAFAELAKAEML